MEKINFLFNYFIIITTVDYKGRSCNKITWLVATAARISAVDFFSALKSVRNTRKTVEDS